MLLAKEFLLYEGGAHTWVETQGKNEGLIYTSRSFLSVCSGKPFGKKIFFASILLVCDGLK